MRLPRQVVTDNGVATHPFTTIFTPSAVINAGTPTVYSFRGNQLEDCINSGTFVSGNTPLLFDTMWQRYYQYYVIKSTFSVTVFNGDASNDLIVAVFPTQNAITTTIKAFFSQPYLKWKVLGPSSGTRGVVTIKASMTSDKMCGVRNAHTTKEDYAATTNNTEYAAPTITPNMSWFWSLIFWSPNSRAAGAFNYTTRLTYTARWYGRKNLQF